MSKLRMVRPGRVRTTLRQVIAVTAAATTLSLIASTADASAVAGQVEAAQRAEAAAQAAPPGLPDLTWAPWPEWSIWTNFGKADANNWNTWTPSSPVAEESRADECRVGHVLHRGGPLVKDLALKALKGSEADRRKAVTRDSAGNTPIDLANDKDWATAPPPPGFATDQQKRWLTQINAFEHHFDAPEFDTATRNFRRASFERTSTAVFADLVPRAGTDARARVVTIIEATKDGDAYFTALDRFQKELATAVGGSAGDLKDLSVGMSAEDARMFLQSGGFAKVAPVSDSVEFRTEVEALKIRWSNCDPENPADPYRVMDHVVDTARAEWKAERDGQAAYRNTITAAEAQAYNDMWNASFAMVEAVGQAWVAEEVLSWQRKQGSGWRPTAAEKAKIDAELKNTQTRITAQITLAKKYSDSAKAQSAKVDVAQTDAAKAAAAMGAPRGRGLQYAQQSAQVTKASAAGAEAAAKAANTALLASKATVADSGALFSRARAEANALEAQYRRAAAQESAAQATAAATAAAGQATAAAKAAATAKAARTRGESAEAKAKAAADVAHAKLATARTEGVTAAAARKRADAERAKAAAAETRAQNEQAAAAAALQRAQAAGETASAKSGAAMVAERQAGAARDEAVAAERREDAAASRAAAFEAAAAAAQGTSDAAAARAAATEARGAATDAADAAGRARSAANTAGTAAIAARKAATESTAAASRSRAASDGAQAAAAVTHAQATAAHAAAADAINASQQAAQNVRAAEAFARIATADALKAKADASVAGTEAKQAQVESALTAGYAFAAAQAATAASDAAATVVNPANEAISLGSPYKEIDASAGMAVLVGQSAKTLAEQQAAAAQVKADEADKAAAAAKAAAGRAGADAKLAAEAAATAATQAAKAAQSVKQARVSAVAAASDAAATVKAASNATQYDIQARADAAAADGAATAAEGEAAAARSAATDAEKDAASAHGAATVAEADATAAGQVAAAAERDATAAETAAASAQQSATEADQAAKRAEDAAKKRLEEERKARVDAGSPDTGAPLSGDDRALLLAHCGQTCVDEWQEAVGLAGKDVLDWARANGGAILLDLIGYTDAKACFSSGDIEACLWTAVNALSLAAIATKLPALSVAITRITFGITKFFEASARGKRILKEFRTLLEKLKKEPKPPCAKKALGTTATTSGAAARAMQLRAAHPLPCGFEMPELDARAIDDIREYHFPGGSKVTDLKGTFRADLTNGDLHKIFEKGLETPMTGPNADNYYERVFDSGIADVGVTSGKQGAQMTSRIMLVCSKWGDVITMFPIP
ncbi:hypothetical protein [Streptomyces turgidiscabies]|uniref:Methyl-accepting transducer domain-containing protein n=1 Tax=Streptomyces turgidiscabies TaxID=85558 RepID=A0ABU0RQZ8_9ACTN|nr:hypothetical protein [Streptomyces turgidiscabies]MDQ0933375.1 hypothetical protein [Streptomyces turgidiscabies]